MIVEIGGQIFDTDSLKIKSNGKTIEITEYGMTAGQWIQTLTYDDGCNASDGIVGELLTFTP